MKRTSYFLERNDLRLKHYVVEIRYQQSHYPTTRMFHSNLTLDHPAVTEGLQQEADIVSGYYRKSRTDYTALGQVLVQSITSGHEYLPLILLPVTQCKVRFERVVHRNDGMEYWALPLSVQPSMTCEQWGPSKCSLSEVRYLGKDM